MITLQELTVFEKKIVEHIVKKEGREFEAHLPLLRVEYRENTDIGIYVYFQYLEEPPIPHLENMTLGQFVYAAVEELEGSAGFSLNIDEGRITMLECFSDAGEPWPAHISKFAIVDL